MKTIKFYFAEFAPDGSVWKSEILDYDEQRIRQATISGFYGSIRAAIGLDNSVICAIDERGKFTTSVPVSFLS